MGAITSGAALGPTFLAFIRFRFLRCSHDTIFVDDCFELCVVASQVIHSLDVPPNRYSESTSLHRGAVLHRSWSRFLRPEPADLIVTLAHGIYAIAKEMVTWLGEEEADDALAFDTLIRFERIFETEPTESYLVPQIWDSKGGPDEILTYSGNEWRALSDLLRKRWFSRVWIL